MIPQNPDDLHVLAGEFVLGVLDEPDAREVAEALATNIELHRAVTFWEEQLHPLSVLVSPALPPAGTWEAIEARIAKPAPPPVAPRFWGNVVPWRWSTAGFAVAAAGLALWILLMPAPEPAVSPPHVHTSACGNAAHERPQIHRQVQSQQKQMCGDDGGEAAE